MMNEEWADFLAEIERRRTSSYEVATDLTDEGKDAERAFGRVDGYDEVLRLVHSSARSSPEPSPQTAAPATGEKEAAAMPQNCWRVA